MVPPVLITRTRTSAMAPQPPPTSRSGAGSTKERALPSSAMMLMLLLLLPQPVIRPAGKWVRDAGARRGQCGHPYTGFGHAHFQIRLRRLAADWSSRPLPSREVPG